MAPLLERRRYPRRQETYKIWCALGAKWVGAFGVDVSPGGLGIVVPAEMEPDEAEFRTAFNEREFVLRATRIWQQRGTFRGQIVYRCGLKLSGIAADDWDALVRYCRGGAINAGNLAQEELRLVRLAPDDVARLIPQRLQSRLLSMLVERKRLAPLDRKTPLVQYSYGGRIERDGLWLHRLLIHSRVFDDERVASRSYDTRFLFSDDASVVTVDE